MIQTTVLEKSQATVPVYRDVANYITARLGPEYAISHSALRDGQWLFTIQCRRSDMRRQPMVGIITADATTGQLQEIPEEKLRDMREAGAVQAAQERRELARDAAGYVLRSHARIKATVWISDRVDLKVGASGGVFTALPQPRWRFAIDFHLADLHLEQLDLIEVDAQTGQVIPLSEEQLQRIREGVCAAKRLQDMAAAAR